MSTRNIRKHREKLRKNEPAEETLEEFEPHFATTAAASTYEGLVISSGTEHSDNENPKDEPAPAPKKKNKKKNNKQKKLALAKAQHKKDLDEIDQVVAEVNRILGEPPKPVEQPQIKKLAGPSLLQVQYKHMNVDFELNRLFGPDEGQTGRRQRTARLKRRVIIERKPDHKFSVKGLRMSLIDTIDGIKYFKFEHKPDYARHMVKTLENLWDKYHDITNITDVHILSDETVEASIENNDILFMMDANNVACLGIESVICFMEGYFHPKFNFCDENVRLEYTYVENRAFHVAMLKHLHVITNKACHRTALEMAKFMLNIDPSDPLAVIFIIDTIALRAREHQWLVDLYRQWKDRREAKRLFNMRYSQSMALFHLATKAKSADLLLEADRNLKDTILEFPFVVLKLFLATNQTNATVTECKFFQECPQKTTNELKELMQFYSKFVSGKWREPNVWEWLIRNACEVAIAYNEHEHVRMKADELASQTMWLYRSIPLEIKRHMSIISPMAELLADKELPTVERTLSFNPFPSQGKSIDVHNYYRAWMNRGYV